MRQILGLALTLTLGADLAAQQAPPGGAITGIVFDGTTNQPLAGAIVSLARIDNRDPIPRAVTDARGRFVFRNLVASDQYYLGARRFGYEYTRYGWTAPDQSLTTADIARITIAKDQWVDGIRIPLWRFASISGRIVDERAEPVVGVAVRAFTQTSIAGTPQIVAGPIAVTDDRGVYRLGGLAPGRYMVSVLSVQSTVLMTTEETAITRPIGELLTGGIGGSRGTTVSMPTIDVDGRHRLVITNFATPPPPAAGQSRVYAATFYPGVTAWADATPIALGFGANRTNIDVQLRPIPAWRVGGRLEAPGGAPVPQMLLRLMPAGSERLGFGSEAATTAVDRDGTFTFLNVPQGNYTLLAQANVMDFTTGSAQIRLPDAPGFPGGGIAVGSMDGVPGLSYLSRSGAPSPLWARVSVAVGGRDVEGLVVSLHPAVKITGRVAFAEGTPVPAPTTRLSLTAHPVNGDPTLGQLFGTNVSGDPAFPFTINGLLGGTYVVTRSFSTYGIASVVSEGRDVTHTGFDATRGQDFADVVITLTDKKVAITGVVTGRSGPAVAAVIAFPVDRAKWTNFGWEPPNFKTTRSGSSGAFRLQNLADGDYYLIAVDAAKIDAWVDPGFLAAAAPLATRISLKWGDTKAQDLTLTEIVVK